MAGHDGLVTPPGWYPDPWLPTRWRYFDGAAWTGWVHPPDRPVVPPALPPRGPIPVLSQSASPLPRSGGINSSPAAWWWAGGTLVAVLVATLGLAWLVNL